jgi:hypothetical protein
MPFMTSSDMIPHINTLTTCENNKGDDEIMRKKNDPYIYSESHVHLALAGSR